MKVLINIIIASYYSFFFAFLHIAFFIDYVDCCDTKAMNLVQHPLISDEKLKSI